MEQTSFAIENSHKLYTQKQLVDFGNFLLRKYNIRYDDHPELNIPELPPLTGDAIVLDADIRNFRAKYELLPVMPGQQMTIRLADDLVIDAEISAIYTDNKKTATHEQNTL